MNQQNANKQEISPAKRARVSFPVVESIGAAASIIGAPKSLLKSAKHAGCKAFLTGNRIDLAVLIPFLFGMLAKGSDLPEGIATPQDWLALEKAKREAIKRQIDEKAVAPTAEVLRQIAAGVGMIFSELERLAREQPPALAGRSAVEISERMEADIKTLKKNLREKFETIAQ
jgi:hypothetical protein